MLPPPSPERVVDAAAGSARAYSARVPLPQAAAVQAAASLAILALTALVPAAAAGSDAMNWALLQGIVGGLARGLGMEAWWLPIHAVVPGLVWTLGFDLPPVYALGVLPACVAVLGRVANPRAAFLSSRAAAQAVAGCCRDRSFTFLDLGCGLGGVLACLARARPAGRYYGIESAPVPFLLSRLRAALGAQSCRISWGDFRDLDLGRYDVVYAYLSPAAMGDLWHKASREMRCGSLLISNGFAVPGVPPAFTVATGAKGDSRLLLWRMNRCDDVRRTAAGRIGLGAALDALGSVLRRTVENWRACAAKSGRRARHRAVLLHDPMFTLRVLRYAGASQSRPDNRYHHRRARPDDAGHNAVFAHWRSAGGRVDTGGPAARLGGLMRVVTRAHHAALYAHGGPICARPEGGRSRSRLTHDLAEMLFWCFAPEMSLRIAAMLLRTSRAQNCAIGVLGFKLADLRGTLLAEWRLAACCSP